MSRSAHSTDCLRRKGAALRSGRALRFPALLLAMTVLLSSCTDNPFESESVVSGSDRRIGGSVVLADQSDHSGVYLWLEGFGAVARSGSDGRFSILLPPAASQSASGGVTGIFNLYAFLGNYRTASIRTVVKNGTFSLPTDAIDEEGNIRNELFMQELFSVETTLSRSSIEADSPRVITMTIYLKSSIAGAEVYFPRRVNDVEGPIVLRNIVTGEAVVRNTVVTGVEISDYIKLGSVPFDRSLMLIIPKGTMKAGRYEIIPYILPQRQTAPMSLLNSLAEHATELGPNYVFYPMRRSGGMLTVTPN